VFAAVLSGESTSKLPEDLDIIYISDDNGTDCEEQPDGTDSNIDLPETEENGKWFNHFNYSFAVVICNILYFTNCSFYTESPKEDSINPSAEEIALFFPDYLHELMRSSKTSKDSDSLDDPQTQMQIEKNKENQT